MRLAFIEREEFAHRAERTGFRIEALFGDYDRTPFNSEESPVMIWVLEEAGPERAS
jgi:replicative superfamily II helicase